MRCTYTALAIAAALWGVVFALELFNFWAAMAGACLVIAALALRCEPGIKALFRYRAGMLMAGAAGAAFLYVVFTVGHRAAIALFDFAPPQIESVYQIRTMAPTWAIVVLIAVVIGPAEEVFWRGFIQTSLAARLGELRGLVAMALAYSAVHLWAWNAMLLAAALVGGLFWGYLFYRMKSLIPCIISHVLWDLAVFVFYPLSA